MHDTRNQRKYPRRIGFVSMLAGIGCFASCGTAWAEPKALDAVDMIVDWKDLLGQRVTVTGCFMMLSDDTAVSCQAANGVGSIRIASPSLNREGLRRALKECSGMDDNVRCEGSVTGVVFDSYDDPGIKNGEIQWDVP